MGDTNVSQSQVGVIGDPIIHGGIHFHRSSTGKPLQRPAPVDHFTDRDRELKQLLEDLQPGRVVTLCGPGGIGKTALSSKAIWTLAPAKKPPKQFPDGIIFHSFYGKPDMALAFEHIVRSFDEESRDTSPEAAFRVLSGKEALLILDGTEEAGDLQSVLQIRGNCGVIVTSRKRQDAVAELQDIESMDLDEAAKLLQAWAIDQAGEEEVVKHICEIVGGLPLAVRLAGRYLLQTGEPALEYLEWLKESPLEALHLANRKLESVGILLKRSLDQVSESARDVLSVCGLLAFSPFNGEVIAAALQEIQIREPLNELILYGLLNRFGGQYEISHALIHTYARERLKSDDAVIGRLAGYYKTLADESCKQGLEGYNRLDLDRPHIMKVMEGCRDRSEWKAIKDLVWAVEDYLDIRGYWTERLSALKMGVKAAKESDDRYKEGAFLGNLGLAYRSLGQVEKAIEYHEQALEISREIGHRQGEGNHLGNLGNAYSALGQVEKAIEYYEQALEISREIGDRQNEGAWLGNLGLAYSDLGQVEKAIEYYEQALEISREIGHRRGEGSILGNLGIAYRALGQKEKAIEYYEQALEISREIGHRQGEGSDLGKLGTAYWVLGQVEKAIEYYEQALEISREIGHRQNEGVWLGNLGLAYSDLGQVEKAVDYLKQSLAIFEEIKSPKAELARQLLSDIEME